MDVTKQTQLLIEALKADKSMAQPWRNYAISDASRLQALIEKGLKTTNQTPPPDLPSEESTVSGCTCIPGQKRNVTCPAHGINN